MAKLSRVLQKVFGFTGGTGEFGQFGSESTGTPVTTKDLATIQTLAAYDQGLYAATANANEPPRIQDFNSLFLLLTTQLKYLFQNGIPEWIATENYYANISFVQVAGVLYQATSGTDVSPNINHNPVGDDGTYWKPVGEPVVVDTIAALRASSVQNCGIAIVRGYAAVGDGGGGPIRYWDAASTETDNGGTIIKQTSITTGRWKIAHNGTVCPEWFGAVGDGVTDDMAEIQAAINATGVNVLKLSIKSYLSSASLTIAKQNFCIEGESHASGYLSELKFSTGGLVVTYPQFNMRRVRVCGSSNTTDKGSDTTQIGLALSEASQNVDCTLTDCQFIFLNKCIDLWGRNLRIQSCTFSNSHNAVNIADNSLSDIRDLEIYGSRFHSMIKTGESTACIVIAAAADFYNVNITGNHIDDCGTFFSGYAGNALISANTYTKARGAFLEVDSTGTAVTTNARTFTVHNNILHVTSPTSIQKVGMSFAGTYQLLVKGNHITRCAMSAITTSVAHSVIVGNVIENAGQYTTNTYYGIEISGALSTVQSNTVRQGAVDSASNLMLAAFHIAADRIDMFGNKIYNMAGKEVALEASCRIYGATPKDSPQRVEYANAAPSAGLHARGDITWHTEPVAGGTVGWVCTAGGTPGTWKSFGTISA